MQTTTTDLDLHGVPLRVSRTGQGRPLLLLHGGGGPCGDGAFVRELAERMEVIEPVHPGFGGTRTPRHFDSVDDLAFLYLDLLDRLGLEQVSLLGIAVGGWTALELATRNDHRIARLALVNSIGIKPGGRDTRDIPDIFALSPPEVEQLMWHDQARRFSAAGLAEAQWQAIAANRSAHALYVWEPYMHNPKLRHRLHRVRKPALVLWGRENQFLPQSYGQALQALIPGAAFDTIAEAGHFPHIEQPAATARRALEFFQG